MHSATACVMGVHGSGNPCICHAASLISSPSARLCAPSCLVPRLAPPSLGRPLAVGGRGAGIVAAAFLFVFNTFFGCGYAQVSVSDNSLQF